jgi:hypothetical protein
MCQDKNESSLKDKPINPKPKVISNKEYTALIVVSASWVYFVGANLVFALSDRANTRFAPTIA